MEQQEKCSMPMGAATMQSSQQQQQGPSSQREAVPQFAVAAAAAAASRKEAVQHTSSTKLNTKRAQLRKQTSSQQQLDSCGSSDSGQGTNSTGSLTASSLVSVAGAAASAGTSSSSSNGCNGGSSCASGCLRVSSASSSSSSANSLAGSLSSSTLFALCNSIGLQSVAPTETSLHQQQQQRQLAEGLPSMSQLQQASLDSAIRHRPATFGGPQLLGPNQALGVHQASIAESPLLHQLASRRRQSWLTGLESLHQNSSPELAATTYQHYQCHHRHNQLYQHQQHQHQQSSSASSGASSSFGAQVGAFGAAASSQEPLGPHGGGSTEPMLPLGASIVDEQEPQNDASGRATLNDDSMEETRGETYGERKKEWRQRSVRLGGRIRRIQFFPTTDGHSSASSTSTSSSASSSSSSSSSPSSSSSSMDGHSWAPPATHHSNTSLSIGSSSAASSSASASPWSHVIATDDNNNQRHQNSSSEEDSSSDPQSSPRRRRKTRGPTTKAPHTNKKPAGPHKSGRDRVAGRLLVCLDLNELEVGHLKRCKVLHSPGRLARHLVQLGRVRHRHRRRHGPLSGPRQPVAAQPLPPGGAGGSGLKPVSRRSSSLFWRLVASFSSSSSTSSSSSSPSSIALSSPTVSSAAGAASSHAAYNNATEQPVPNKQVDDEAAGSSLERVCSESFGCPLVELLRAAEPSNASLLRQRLLLSASAGEPAMDGADFDIQYTDTWAGSRAASAANLERLDSIDEEAACSSSQQHPSIDLNQEARDEEDWCGVQHATGRPSDGCGVQVSSGDDGEEEEEGQVGEKEENDDSSSISDGEEEEKQADTTIYRHQLRHRTKTTTRKKNKNSSSNGGMGRQQIRNITGGLRDGLRASKSTSNGNSEVDMTRSSFGGRKGPDTDRSGRREEVGPSGADDDDDDEECSSYRVAEGGPQEVGVVAGQRTTRQSGEQSLHPSVEAGAATLSSGCDLDAQQPTTDDDYFYDDELYIGGSAHRGSHSQRSGQPPTTRCGQVVGAGGCGAATTLEPASSSILASSSSSSSSSLLQQGQPLLLGPPLPQASLLPAAAPPLLFWGPSMRRVSCPVGQPLAASYSAAAWRQLLGPNGLGAHEPPAVLCQGCLRAFAPHYLERAQRQGNGARDSFSSVSSFGQPQAPLDTQLGAKLKLFGRRSPSSLRKASLTTCSDYFSSFDQSCTTEPAPATLPPPLGPSERHASLVSVASSEGCWRAGGGAGSGLGDLALANWIQRARPSLGQVPSSATGAAPQDTYYGGGGGALQQAGELRRQSTITGFDHQRIQPAQRSPSLCLASQHQHRRLSDRSGLLASGGLGPGSAQRSAGLLPAQAPTSWRLSPTHSTGGSSSSSSSPTNGQSWTPAQHQHQQQQSASSHQFHQHRYGGAQVTSGAARRHCGQPAAAGFSRARLESLESDRGSSPTSWSASSCSLRSPTGVSGSLKNPLNNPKKFQAAATNKLGAASSVCLFPPPRGQHLSKQQLQQQQAVYFFLCCCQRNREPAPPPQPAATRASQGQSQIVTSELALAGSRAPLVARPAIVGSAAAPQLAAQRAGATPRELEHHQQSSLLQQQQQPQPREGGEEAPRSRKPGGAEPLDAGSSGAKESKPVPPPEAHDQSPLEDGPQRRGRLDDELPASSKLSKPDNEDEAEVEEEVEPLERQLSRLLRQLELLKRTALLNASATGNGASHTSSGHRQLQPALASGNTNWPWQLLETVSQQLLETEQLLALFGVAPSSALIETEPYEGPNLGARRPVNATHSANLSMGLNRSVGGSRAGASAQPPVAVSLQGHHHHHKGSTSRPPRGANQVLERSLDQARYLYSTLTSNAGALLAVESAGPSASASTGAGSMTPSSSPSSTRTTGGPSTEAGLRNSSQSPSRTPQRKQAQFAMAPDRRRPANWQTTTTSSAPPDPTTCVSPLGGGAPQTGSTTRTTTASRRKKFSSSSSSFSSSSSSDEERETFQKSGRARDSPEPSDGHPEVGSGQPPELTATQQQQQQRQPLAPTIGVKCGAAARASSTSEPSRRASGQTRGSGGSVSQAASRSSSMGAGALDGAAVGGAGGSNSLVSSNQLQPGSMDPAMHALWAQGADLDTGNGNFIMATRRRRSVHVLHQSQQLQQLQQQQQQLHLQLHNQPTTGTTTTTSLAASEGALSSGGAPSTNAPASGNVKCFKIDEHAPCPVGQAAEAAGTTAGSSSQHLTRRLKQNELMRLRVNSSSMDAASLAGQLLPEEPKQRPQHAPLLAGTLTGTPQEVVGLEPARERAEKSQERVVHLGELEYDLDELESANNQLLSNLFDWNYPIFKLADNYGDLILSKLSFKIFFDSGFFESFKIPKQAFFNFFHALEEGYHHKPYHNRIHAADVLHAVYYLTSQPIDNFCQVPLDLIDHYDNLLSATGNLRENTQPLVASTSGQLKKPPDGGLEAAKLHNHIVAVVVAAAAAAEYSEIPFGVMGANLTALEVMALYTAAAMHDYQHPGRTNSFLVATGSSLALLYNDRSVLENHHSAAAWGLFYSGPSFNWLCNLEKDEFKRFRFMIIELILATDLMRHYELVSAFNKKLNSNGRHNIDWFCESDRLLIMEIIIKLADVNGPMKGHQLHCQWTNRIAQEFYEQGDEERALNLPVSLYMDRSDPRLPELQKSFINHLVGPLSHSYAAAGFFPKTTEPRLLELSRTNSSPEGEADETNSVYNQSKYWLIGDGDEDACKLNKQFLRCTQTSNLRDNFLYWDAKSKEQKQS